MENPFRIFSKTLNLFGTGKLSLTGHSVVSVFLAFKTPEWNWNVDIHLHSKEFYFNGSGKDRESKREDDSASIYLVTIKLASPP